MQHVIERAFEIARSGDCQSVPALGQKLVKEGFEGVSEHLNGDVLQKQLSALIKASQLDAQLEPRLLPQAFETAQPRLFHEAHFHVGG